MSNLKAIELLQATDAIAHLSLYRHDVNRGEKICIRWLEETLGRMGKDNLDEFESDLNAAIRMLKQKWIPKLTDQARKSIDQCPTSKTNLERKEA